MTKIKLCGLSRPCDIQAVNALLPEYIGFVFAPKSRRFVSFDKALALKRQLDPSIAAVGVFVREDANVVARAVQNGVIDMIQLHGGESEEYIRVLRTKTNAPIIRAYRVESAADIALAESSSADFILLDSGAGGTGQPFDWNLIHQIKRPYFLAGGLDAAGAAEAVSRFHPYALDVSSGIETNGVKDADKMAAFVTAVRSERK